MEGLIEMKAHVKRHIIALAFIIILCLGGCDEVENPEHVNGGTTNKTDYTAPKDIKSKEITGFRTAFYLYGEWTELSEGERGNSYSFKIQKDENGKLIASEYTTKVKHEADEELLNNLQKVIEEQHLAGMNGVYEVTEGLPYEFQKTTTVIEYASGEEISFTINNDPEAKWIKDVYLVFAEWFDSKGIHDLMPPKVDSLISRIDIDIRTDTLYTEYSGIIVSEEDAIDGENYLLQRSVYDITQKKSITWDFHKFPEDYYERIGEIIEKYDIRPFDKYSPLYGYGREDINDTDYDNSKICIYIETVSGHRQHIGISSDSDMEMLKPFMDELIAYHESIFEQS